MINDLKVGLPEQKTKKSIENEKKSEKGLMKSLDFGVFFKDLVKKEKTSFEPMQNTKNRDNNVNSENKTAEAKLITTTKEKTISLSVGVENGKPNVKDKGKKLDFEGNSSTTEEVRLVRKKEVEVDSSSIGLLEKMNFSSKEKAKLVGINPVSENAANSIIDKETKNLNTVIHGVVLMNQEIGNNKDSKKAHPTFFETKYEMKIESANGHPRDLMSNKQVNPKEFKELKQIEILKHIAKELRSVERESVNQKTFPSSSFYSAHKHGGPEKENVKHSQEAKIHLTLPLKTDDIFIKKTALESTESKMHVKENIKTDDSQKDSFSLDMRTENFQKNMSLKVSSFAEVKEIIMKDVDRFVDMKIMSPRKIILTLGDLENGRMEIQVEKKDNVIFIRVRIDEKGSQEKVEASMEQLKTELKEKAINIEYDVEKEQKEKRKEQEQHLMKEDIREEDEEYAEATDKFERFMEVGQI